MAETKNVKRDSKGAQRIIMGAAGLFLGCLFLFPIYILVLNSFKNTKGIFTDVIGFPNAATFTLANYPNAFEALEYIRSFMNSLTITVIATVLILLISAMAAWVLVRYKTKTSKIIFFLFAASMLIPFQCVMLPLVGFASRIGIMNPQGLIFMYMGFGSSMSIVMFHSFIKNIPEELEEAATIDGCGSFRLFFSIVIPLMRTILITVAVLNVMWIWNDYLLPSLIINKPGWQTLPLKTYLFFGQFAKRWDLASAGLIMCIIPIIIFYLCCQKYIVKGITDGAIK
ncbi:carbohydrate ABC transporter membrane protein 2 (CUT1 family) [Hungatella effluvii]|uniref:Carbohydrate ABC transporter membrane protein 2 (CUT1 family) n=1 Tax=Hungatella effluvii TaxID=1096246 RepID=A0A2V3YFN8_9FIRM|nr:carbohydrate ABC transporter permease [Hungatella effluvii]PXX56180.1 carbohydrate ABC transporter membrane protein 2 (CUT1 family) [Hungatella effluvii]